VPSRRGSPEHRPLQAAIAGSARGVSGELGKARRVVPRSIHQLTCSQSQRGNQTSSDSGDRHLAILGRVTLNGFKSIKAMDLELRPLNVLIGANGAGKSNLVSFFKMLNEMMAGRLQQYIGTTGRAQSLLHFGPKVTPQMEARLEFDVDNAVDTYSMRLFHAAGDTLIFADESLSFHQVGYPKAKLVPLGS